MNKHDLAPDEKADVDHNEYLQDHHLESREKNVTGEEAARFAQLTDDELAVQKQLVRKIDILIMPLVILVYLMNYIDR